MHWRLLFIPIGRYLVIDVIKPISGTIFLFYLLKVYFKIKNKKNLHKSHKLA